MPLQRSRIFSQIPRVLAFSAALLVMELIPIAAFAGPARTGEEIYRRQCASCHGAAGEGTDEHYPRALVGERPVDSLSRLIAKTMPEDAPGECVGEDADKVAAYIFDAFYSKAAQARNRFQPPRIELSRLTVRQYRSAVADLIGSFRWTGAWDKERGLKGEYNAAGRRRRQRNGGTEAMTRIDREIQFHFGADSPLPEQNALKELSRSWHPAPILPVPLSVFRPFSQEYRVNWQGAILAPDSGEYEFIIKTENAARLWVNDNARPLIDAGVKSGDQTEFRESITLLGGRVYPIRLELIRGKEKSASIALLWKRPRRTAEVISQTYLSPTAFPESFVLQASFPPDDRSVGYERGTSISKAWDQATTDAAIEVAGYVASRLKDLADVREGAKDRDAKAREFCRRFAERAFRRPLAAEQQAFFVDRQFQEARALEVAVTRSILLTLKSPRFLYREIGRGSLDSYDVASRLSFGLWDSLPDQTLLDAAASGQLLTRDQVVRQAERMVTDLRARSKLRSFLLQWLKVDHYPDISKDKSAFPGFDETVVSDLRSSLELFLDDVIGGEKADFRELLNADYVYLNGRLAPIFGAKLAPEAPFQKISLEPGKRSGVLTHPYLMASFAYTASSSPIHRGVFLSRSLLGRVLRPPPEAVAPLAADLHPDLTTRQRVTIQTKPEACQSCHAMINSLGFTLENFDAIGRYRSEEKGRPIDASGTYETRGGESISLDGVQSLARFLAASEETHTAFVQQLFHNLIKQPIRAFGYQALPTLRKSFESNDYSIRKLIVEIMAASALTPRLDKK
jgi:cytochrome c553